MRLLRIVRFLLVAAAVMLLLGGRAGGADAPMVQAVSLAERGRDLVLNADVSLNLNNQLEDAAERGLPLFFTVEVEINRPRWYWFDETVLTATQTWRIAHNPLTHQWRVSSGSLALPVSSLSEALSVVRHVRNWRIADKDAFKPGANHEGRMRVRFDVSQLSKAFQVNALNSSDWSLATPWTEFSTQVVRETLPPVPVAPATAAPSPVPDRPADKANDKPADKATDRPVDRTNDRPADRPNGAASPPGSSPSMNQTPGGTLNAPSLSNGSSSLGLTLPDGTRGTASGSTVLPNAGSPNGHATPAGTPPPEAP
ncbi:DUF4390 domain-containing protein [Pigmentiphaga litoralis]|uniref:DUF4390 domain-containing protein n=1 Tax=Pigmentiphaga litoralis TaxID=516702 RepID=UPI003B4382B0